MQYGPNPNSIYPTESIPRVSYIKNMILLGEGTVFTRDAQRPMIEHGAVVMEDSKIVEVGDFEMLRKKYPEADYVDAHGGIIHPGLIKEKLSIIGK